MIGGVNTVKVLGQRHEIVVFKQPTGVWLAAGNYMGEPLRVSGSSRSAAAREWRDAAKYKGIEDGGLAETGPSPAFFVMGLALLFITVLFGLPILTHGTPY
jgi:hypothetical protein